MTNKQEQLRERYEDIVFAMMMDELASEQGRAALEENERLQNDPGAAVPEEIDRRCMQTIRSQLRKERARHAGRVTMKAMGRLAMAFGVLSVLFLGAFAVSEDLRLGTMNLIVETFGKGTDFYFAPPSEDEVSQIKAGWVPDGYTLNDEGLDEMNSWFVYKDADGKNIQGRYVMGEGQLLSMDTQDAEVKYVQIRDAEATLAIKEGRAQIIWASTEGNGFISIFSNGLSEEEIIQVAQNVEY